MLKRIEKPKVRRRFWDMMREKDDMVVHKEYTRTVKTETGTKTTKYLMKPHELERTKIERVFNTALNWYTDHYNKMQSIMPEVYEDGLLPSLKTTNPEIGHSAGCSDRTARTMLTHLVDMGVIVKTSKGSKGGILIRFSEAILWGTTAEEQSEIQPQNVCPSPQNWKNFPHNNTLRKENEKGNISGVDSVDKERREDREGDNRMAQFYASCPNLVPIDTFEDRSKGAAAAAPSVDNSVEKIDISAMPRHSAAEKEAYRKAKASENQRLRTLSTQSENDSNQVWWDKCKQSVMYFWAVSYEKLYAGRQYDADTVKTILNVIYHDVFFDFKTIRNEQELATFTARALAKLEKAATYYDRKPDAYLPEPHSIMVAGKGYFDKGNSRGFVGLEAWMRADEAKTPKTRVDFLNPKAFRERKINRLLAQARKDFEKVRVSAKLRVEVQHLDMVGLMQYYGVVFQNLGDVALKQFNSQILEQQRIGFRAAPVLKKGQTPLIVEVDSWLASFGND